MSSSALIRWSGLAALLSGALLIASSLVLLMAPSTTLWSILYVIALFFILVGLVGLHALQKGHYGFIGWAGFYTLFVAHTVEISSVVLFFLLESAVLFRWLIWVGALGLLVGFVLYGLATRQARVLPGWCGGALIIGYPLTIVLAQYGGILFGLVWLALGYLLSSRRGTAGGRSARMS